MDAGVQWIVTRRGRRGDLARWHGPGLVEFCGPPRSFGAASNFHRRRRRTGNRAGALFPGFAAAARVSSASGRTRRAVAAGLDTNAADSRGDRRLLLRDELAPGHEILLGSGVIRASADVAFATPRV